MSVYSFLHYHPRLGEEVFIHTSAQVIGAVTLGARVSVWPGTVLRGDMNTITVGADTNIQDLSVLHVTHPGPVIAEGAPLVIGSRVTIGHRVALHGCTIGDECLIGIGSIILDRAVLESQVMVGAGSLVPPGKRLESGWLYMGSPVKKIRRLTDAEIANFTYSAQRYVKLVQQYRQTM
jgi:carbonic anhydrase/acetyltransferase-like protein (isoleucine patch superfamily)